MTRTHLTATRLIALATQLSDRDLNIVATLAMSRVATKNQLQRLHFAEGSALTQSRRSRAALERLVDQRVLTRLDRRIGGVRSGSSGFIYALGPAGQRLRGSQGPAGGHRVRRPWTPSLPFLAHRLAVTELFVTLVEQERLGLVELLRFQSEPDCWRKFNGPAGRVVTLKPDAFVATALGEYEEYRFIEVDRATESLSVISSKLAVYRQYWASGREQRQHGLFPGVLFVVPDEWRAEKVRRECTRVPEGASALFEVVVWTDAVAVMTGGGA
jgi:hypothetical protein